MKKKHFGLSNMLWIGLGVIVTVLLGSTLYQRSSRGPTQGNGLCELGETSTNAPSDCSSAPVAGNNLCEFGETATSVPADCGLFVPNGSLPPLFAVPVEDNCPHLDPIGWFNQDPVTKLFFCATWREWDKNPLTYATELGTYTVTYHTSPARIIVVGPTEQIGYPVIEGGQIASGFWVDAEGEKIMGPIFFYKKGKKLYVDETFIGVIRDNPARKTPHPQG